MDASQSNFGASINVVIASSCLWSARRASALEAVTFQDITKHFVI